MAAGEKKGWSTWLPIVISIGAFGVSVLALYLTWNPGGPVGVIPRPAGYAIVRGNDTNGEGEPGLGLYPSDHIVLPLEWANATGSTALIKSPMLKLRELDDDGDTTGDILRFYMVEELPEMSATTLQTTNSTSHRWANSIVLDPHSVKQTPMLFRIEGGDTPSNEDFRFSAGKRYQVDINFWRSGLRFFSRSETEETTIIKRLTIQPTVDSMSPYGEKGHGWAYWSLLPDSSSAQDRTPA